MTTPRADRLSMEKRSTFAAVVLTGALMLMGCTTGSARPTPSTTATSSYERAFRAERYEDAAQLASRAPRRDDRARLIEGMARTELDQNARAGALLRPLLSSSDPDIRGRAAATLGLIAQDEGRPGEASRLLNIAADDLSGSDAVWASRYAARAGGADGAAAGLDFAEGDGAYQIQFGSFSTQARAQRHAQAVSRITRSTGIASPRVETVKRGARTLYAVRAGSFGSRSAAADAASRMNTDTAVVRTN